MGEIYFLDGEPPEEDSHRDFGSGYDGDVKKVLGVVGLRNVSDLHHSPQNPETYLGSGIILLLRQAGSMLSKSTQLYGQR